MKLYLSYFRLKFITGLQYRASALAGLSTQFFFGFVFVSVYIAFYESNSSNLPMELGQLITYVWLSQAFFSLIYMWQKDSEIISMIKSGNIAYELSRPQDLYLMWFFKIYSQKLSSVTLRFLPVLLVALILPKPYNLVLNTNILTNIMFLITLIISSVLVTTIVLLYHVMCLITLDEKGIVNIFMVIADILSGLVVPVVFFPKYLQNISDFLPFRYVSDFPFRLYVGNISYMEGIKGIIIQIIWIIILVIIGRLITKKALNKAVIQGG